VEHVNSPRTDEELSAIERSIDRDSPFEAVPGLPKRQGRLAWKSRPDPVDDQKYNETIHDNFLTLT